MDPDLKLAIHELTHTDISKKTTLTKYNPKLDKARSKQPPADQVRT